MSNLEKVYLYIEWCKKNNLFKNDIRNLNYFYEVIGGLV